MFPQSAPPERTDAFSRGQAEDINAYIGTYLDGPGFWEGAVRFGLHVRNLTFYVLRAGAPKPTTIACKL